MKANKGKYVLVVEGAIPTKDGGIYCKIGGKTAIDCSRNARPTRGGDRHRLLRVVGRHAVDDLAARRFQTGASSVSQVLGKPVVTIPGCPPNPYNFLSTVVHFLTFGNLPAVDKLGGQNLPTRG
jgi:hydrogenase small subunit